MVMKRTAMILYHTSLEREQLLCRLSPIPFLELQCQKLDVKKKTDFDLPVICVIKDLPSALMLKQRLACPKLLLFCPTELAGMCSLLEDDRCITQSFGCSSVTLGRTLHSLLETKQSGCVQESTIWLTKREQQVLALMVSGQDMNSIAHILGVKRSTVVAHKKHLFLKSGVHTTSQLVVWAMLKQVCQQ